MEDSRMKLWITNESRREGYARTNQQFFAKVLEIDDDFAQVILDFEAKNQEFRNWMRALEVASEGRTTDSIEKAIEEAPKWLRGTEAPSEEKPKKRGTAARSSTKWRGKRKKTDKKSSTSQATDE
jgi:hypothetical protein